MTITHGTHQGWRWVVLVGAFFNLLLHASINYNAGVIGVAVVDVLGADPVDVSWLMSCYGSLFALAAPVASTVINLTDCRTCVVTSGILSLVGYASSSLPNSIPWLFLTLGLTGVGHSLCQSGSVLILSYYFPDALQMVHGVSLAGSGLGSFLHPFLTQLLLDTFGFKGTMLMLGGIAFHSAAFGLLFIPTRLEMKSKSNNSRTEETRFETVCSKVIPPLDMFKVPAFSIFILTIFFYSMTFQSMVVSIPSYIKIYIGLSAREGSIAAMAFGGGSVTSRFFGGFAASDERVGDSLMFFGMSSILSLLSFCGSYIMTLSHGTIVYSFLFGLYSGGLYSLACSMLVAIVALDKVIHGYGCMMLIYGLGGIVGPPILAWIVDIEGPQMLFICCGMTSLMCTILSMVTIRLQKHSTPPHDLDLSIKETSVYILCEDPRPETLQFPDDGSEDNATSTVVHAHQRLLPCDAS